jgi:hypothetical protein
MRPQSRLLNPQWLQQTHASDRGRDLSIVELAHGTNRTGSSEWVRGGNARVQICATEGFIAWLAIFSPAVQDVSHEPQGPC